MFKDALTLIFVTGETSIAGTMADLYALVYMAIKSSCVVRIQL